MLSYSPCFWNSVLFTNDAVIKEQRHHLSLSPPSQLCTMSPDLLMGLTFIFQCMRCSPAPRMYLCVVLQLSPLLWAPGTMTEQALNKCIMNISDEMNSESGSVTSCEKIQETSLPICAWKLIEHTKQRECHKYGTETEIQVVPQERPGSVFISLHLLLGDWFSKKNLLCLLFGNPMGAWWETLLSIYYFYPIHDRKTTLLNWLRNHKYLISSYLLCIEIIKSWELTYIFGDLIIVFAALSYLPQQVTEMA